MCGLYIDRLVILNKTFIKSIKTQFAKSKHLLKERNRKVEKYNSYNWRNKIIC